MTLGTATAPAMDLTGPLPAGTYVLEASAGTGKTYTIAGMVCRYVAGGTPLDRVLAITFGRAATGELRSRVRERLLLVHRALGEPSPGRCTDPVVRHLGGLEASAVAEARERLARALAGFDAATVATTHEFCQQVLHGLGVAADLDPGTTLVEDLGDLVAEACDDLYLAYATATGKAPFG